MFHDSIDLVVMNHSSFVRICLSKEVYKSNFRQYGQMKSRWEESERRRVEERRVEERKSEKRKSKKKEAHRCAKR